jgi:multidrug resistance efflux pump
VADDQATTDLEVRRLQITFAETYLTAPFAGTVTAVFKDVGECVQAGEPVIRVENDAVVFLTGRIQYFGVLKIGQDVVVRAADLYESGQSQDFPGKVKGIRGHAADDDEWEVFIECDNPVGAGGRRLLPIYYQFDKDTTTILVTT